MANELEAPNFSIEDTMEMGMGNQEILKDLFAPETVTSKSEVIEEIKPETKKKPEKAPESAKGKKEPEKKEEEEEEENLVDKIFGKEEEEEEEEKPVSKKPIKKETEKVENKEEEGSEEESEEEGEGNSFSALSKDLFKLGVFNKEEDEEEVEITSPEAFLDRFNHEKKKGAMEMVSNFIGQFGEDYQQAFDAIFVKGVDPKEYFGAYNTIQNFAELDLTQEANQELVVRQGLLDQGFEPDKIAAKLEKIKSYGDLEDEAKGFHQVLVKKEAAKLSQLQAESEAKLQQQMAARQLYTKNINTILQDKLTKKEFDGIPINPKLATELQDFLITEKYQTPTKEKLTEFDKTILDLKRPENHEKRVKVALLLKVLEKDPTLSTIQKTGITKKTDSLFSEVARQGQGKSTAIKAKEKTEQSKSWFS